VKSGWRAARPAARLQGVTDPAALLAAYDDQLRTDAETPGAIAQTRLGPVRLVTFAGGRGFVTYRDLGDLDAGGIADLVGQALEHYGRDPQIAEVEWKTRGHDRAPGLHKALSAHGFASGEPESIMIGEARLLDVPVPLPGGVRLRRVTAEPDVRAMCAMQGEVFGDPAFVTDRMATDFLRRMAGGDELQLWIAEAAGQIVTAGSLSPVPGTEFAGIWGGATRPKWRGQGIYRALTAARARAALALGKRFVNSDSTEYSRPILERSGLVKVSTTTPYEWRRT
jgi:hypothetical protein